MHVGAVELHVPVVEVPSPVHSTAVVLDRPKPLVHVNVHELPWLLESEHVGEFPLAGVFVESSAGQVIAEKQKHCFYQWANTIFSLIKTSYSQVNDARGGHIP